MEVPNYEPLYADIANFLKDNDESSQKLNIIIQGLKEKTLPPETAFSDLIDLVKGNNELTENLKNASVKYIIGWDPGTAFAKFLSSISSEIRGDPVLLSKITHLTSLFVSDLIIFSFFETEIIKLISSDKMQEMLQHLNTSVQIYKKSISNLFINTNKTQTTSFIPTESQQLLIMLSLCLSNESFQSALKCLRLFSLSLVSLESAKKWLFSLNELLGDFFYQSVQKQISEKSEIDISIREQYLPALIYQNLKQGLKPGQAVWVFGEEVSKILEKDPKPAFLDPLALKNNDDIKRLHKSKKNDSRAALPISDLQSLTFYLSLRAAAHSARNSSPLLPALPEGIITAIFGKDLNIDKNDAFFSIFIKQCQKFGFIAFSNEIRLLNQQLESIDVFSYNYRPIFAERYSSAIILRGFVLKPTKTLVIDSISSVLDSTIEILRSFISHFSNLNETFEKIISLFYNINDKQQTEIGQYTALSLYYIGKIAKIVEEEKGKADNLSDLVFTETPPFSKFKSSLAIHSDLLFKEFAKMVKKVDEGKELTSEFVQDDFGYIYMIDNQKIYSFGYLNPCLN